MMNRIPFRFAVIRALTVILLFFVGIGHPAAAEQFSLLLETHGGGRIHVDPGNHVVSEPCELFFEEGTQVELIIEIPDDNEIIGQACRFVQWEGDIEGDLTENRIFVTMDRDKYVAARFAENPVLRVESGLYGSVQVSTSWGTYVAMDEGGGYIEMYVSDEDEITLTADSFQGYSFNYWSGIPGGNNTQNPVSFFIDENTVVQAVFIRQYDLLVHIQGQGQLVIDMGKPSPLVVTETGEGGMVIQVGEDSQVVVTATASQYWHFSYFKYGMEIFWKKTYENPYAVTVQDDMEIRAVFVLPNPENLKVVPVDNGVNLSWDPVEPSEFVQAYAVYGGTYFFYENRRRNDPLYARFGYGSNGQRCVFPLFCGDYN
jgi:hypothetical protein